MNRCFLLKPFRILPFSANIKLNAQVTVDKDALQVEFALTGDLNQIVIPFPSNSPVRIYDLWEHTCFEMFLKRKDVPSYIEFNFAPSGDWNCFYISSYRVNDGEYTPIKKQTIDVSLTEERLVLKSDVTLKLLPNFSLKDFESKKIEIGLSSVIEDKNNELNYYALIHKRTKPDFHDGFISF